MCPVGGASAEHLTGRVRAADHDSLPMRSAETSTRLDQPLGKVARVRKVVVLELLSLDGVAEAPETFFGWDDALDAKLAADIATQDVVVLGRRTYAEWATFWPTSDVEPFASFINAVPKHVATSTPLDREWAHATAISGDLVGFVQDLKRQPGGDIGVHGSISVARALLAAGAVDELRLTVGPMIAAHGRRLLDGMASLRLELIRSAASPTGYMSVDYRVTGRAHFADDSVNVTDPLSERRAT